MEYFSDADLDTMREIRDRIVQKVVNQKPTTEFESGSTLEMHAPARAWTSVKALDATKFSIFPTWMPTTFRPGGRPAGRLEQKLIGARERPVFFMRVASGQPAAVPGAGLADASSAPLN